MGRYLVLRSVADIDYRLGQGRGKGVGPNYLPWLFVQEVPSRGRSHKIPGVKVDRTHHLLSDLEATCFLALEYQHTVVDIREQSPYLPYGLTAAVAKALTVRHPFYPGTKIHHVMTSDFCVDIRSGDAAEEVQQISIAVKYTEDLKKKRVRELLAIECEASAALNRPWFLFTEETLPRVVRRNLTWLRYGARLPIRLANTTLVCTFCDMFLASHQEDALLKEILNRCAARMSIAREDVSWLFKYAAWHHLLSIRVTDPIGYLRPLSLARSHDHVLNFTDTPGTVAQPASG